jgi:hypothetical protein
VSFSLPPQVEALLSLGYDGNFQDGLAVAALARAKHEGIADAIPALAEKAKAALVPVPHKTLLDRLTLLGMSMANGKDADQVHAWLHETARLLSDLPQAVLFDAIDACVQEPGRAFLPSVGEIRAKAAGPLQRKERAAARLCHLARLIEQGFEIPEWDADKPAWTYARSPEPKVERWQPKPGETAAILAEFGLSRMVSDAAARALQPEPVKTRADLIAEGVEPAPIIPPAPDPEAMMP